MKKEKAIQIITNGKCLVPNDAVQNLIDYGYSQAEAQKKVYRLIERVIKEPIEEVSCVYEWEELMKHHT